MQQNQKIPEMERAQYKRNHWRSKTNPNMPMLLQHILFKFLLPALYRISCYSHWLSISDI